MLIFEFENFYKYPIWKISKISNFENKSISWNLETYQLFIIDQSENNHFPEIWQFTKFYNLKNFWISKNFQFGKLLKILSVRIIPKNQKINSKIKNRTFVIWIFKISKFRNIIRFTFSRSKIWLASRQSPNKYFWPWWNKSTCCVR